MRTGTFGTRWYPALAAAVVLALAGFFGPAAIRLGSANPITNAADFRAFYCAGSTLLAHQDPYLVEPLRTCERNALGQMHLLTYRDLVVPAPLPPYALQIFGLLSIAPFGAATCLWFAGLLVATFATVIWLRAMSGLPAIVVTLAAVSCAAPAVLLGQMAPLIVMLLLAAAWSVKAKRWWACAAVCTLLAIEPHLALPAIAAVALFVKPCRVPMAVCFGAMLAISLAVSGAGVYETYVLRELPVHSFTEVHAFQTQYSLTTALATIARVGDDAAVAIGRADYVLMLALGIVVARRLAVRLDDDRYLILVPPAFTALGGMYSHAYAMYAAVPAVALCYASDAVKNRGWYLASLAGLALSLLADAAFSDDFVRTDQTALAAALHRVASSDLLASQVANAWQTARMPSSEHAIAILGLMKLPAIAGLLIFIVASTAFAFRRQGLRLIRSRPMAGGAFREAG